MNKDLKQKIRRILIQNINWDADHVAIFQSKGYSIYKNTARWDGDRYIWGRQPNSSKSIFILLVNPSKCKSLPADYVRTRYYVEIPKDIAEKILVLNFVPCITKN